MTFSSAFSPLVCCTLLCSGNVRFRFGSMARLAPNGVNLIRMLQVATVRIAVHLFALLLSGRYSGTDTTMNWDWDWDWNCSWVRVVAIHLLQLFYAGYGCSGSDSDSGSGSGDIIIAHLKCTEYVLTPSGRGRQAGRQQPAGS